MSETIRATRRQPLTIGPLGLPEAIALAVGLLLMLAALLIYFLVLQPTYTRQTKLGQDRADAQKKLEEFKQHHNEGQTTQQSVEQIGNSVVNFERAYLSRRETGRLSLYALLNDLMRRNNVRNTAGPAYAPLDPLKPEDDTRRTAQANNQGGSKGSDRWQTIYPGINITVTVEGKYQNLRKFIRDLEATGQFIVINGVELEGTREQKQQEEQEEQPPITSLPPANPGFSPGPLGARPPQLRPTPNPQEEEEIRRGERVSLRVEMAAYFQREGLAN